MGDKILTKTSGYSGTPLAKKLGIKAGFHVKLVNASENYFNLFTDLPDNLIFTDDGIKKDLIHFFTKQEDEFINNLPLLKDQIKANGIIWYPGQKRLRKL
ncbi:hypothetical protein [Mucilaginibacter sp.]|uniref:hypothetical protein n=1 Tax=Mucilaginibacter sp. TaxID=1882438 RepID=UPI00261A756E|nr:hypothetical protein [Mucilaginibacter sp.]MDB4918767.1 hypothetical protein [Mucilaginibacter sp.]